MIAKIEWIDNNEAISLISSELPHIINEDRRKVLGMAVRASHPLWVGYDKGELLCIYGLIPPTLLSDEAYLWLHTTPAMKEHSFVFIRHSQRAIEEMLTHYKRIVGHGNPDDPRSLAWLRMLGARFGDKDANGLPFTIRAKFHG